MNTMKKFRKWLVPVCVVAMLFTFVPEQVLASYETDYKHMKLESLTYTKQEGMENAVYIGGYNATKNKPEYMLAIPAGITIGSDRKQIVGIGDSVFANKAFAQIYIESNSGIRIGAKAFQNAVVQKQTDTITDHCVNIIGGTVNDVGEYAFSGMHVYGDFTLSSMQGNIGAHAFENARIEGKLTIDGTIEELGDYAFSGLSTSGISLPNTKKIGTGAFRNTAFTEFYIPWCVESLGSQVFAGCSKLSKIYLPANGKMSEVAEDALPNESGMTIVIPDGITNISIYHLEKCNNVTFEISGNNNQIVNYMKDNQLKYQITGGETESTANPEATPTPSPTVRPVASSTVSKQPVAADKQTVVVRQKIRYRIIGKNQVSVQGCAERNAKKLTIPNVVEIKNKLYKVMGIEKKAFSNLPKLKKVVLGNYVKTVGDLAFSKCRSLQYISFGTGVVKVGKKVLYKDKKLKKIVFKSKRLKSIGKNTFYGVPKTVKIMAPKKKVKKYSKLIAKSRK